MSELVSVQREPAGFAPALLKKYPLETVSSSSRISKRSQPISLEIEGLSLSEVAKVVLADHLGYSVIIVGDLADTTTMSLDTSEATDIKAAFEAAMTGTGFGISYAGNIAIISRGEAGAVARSYIRLKYARPETILVGVTTAFGRVQATVVGRDVLVSGSTEDVRAAVLLSRILDVSEISLVSWSLLRLPLEISADAVSLVERLSWTSELPVVDAYVLDDEGLVFVTGYSSEAVDQAVELLEAVAARVNERVIRTVDVAAADASLSAVQTLFGAEISRNELTVVSRPEISALSIRGRAEPVARVMDYLRSISTIDDWISVKVIVVEVTKGTAVDRGLSFGFSSGSFAGDLGFGGTNPGIVADPRGFGFQVGTGGFQAALSWLETSADAQIVATPVIAVRSGGHASLSVGSQVPILDTQVTDTDDGDTITQAITYRDTGIVLDVSPKLLRDGRISMDVRQEFSQASENIYSTVDSPVFDQRSLSTSVVLYPSELALLAGLDSTRQTVRNSGLAVDFLSPLLSNKSGASTRLMILVTADLQPVEQRRAVSLDLVQSLRGVLHGG